MNRILIIRLHAFGDTMATLPYVNGIRRSQPDTHIDLLTLTSNSVVPEATGLFSQVFKLPGGRHQVILSAHALLRRFIDLRGPYDAIIDLQDNKVSHVVRKMLKSVKSSVFDKYAPLFAGERYLTAIQRILPDVSADFCFNFLQIPNSSEVLPVKQKGYKWIVLNPAGFYKTRNWPIDNYIQLSRLMQEAWGEQIQFLLLGDERIREKAEKIEEAFPENVINLVSRTSQLEAFGLLGQCDLVVSEDSGLGHMAWIQGVKTLFLFGSTRADWTAPPYPHVMSLVSSDLACGDCMKPFCIHGDVRCLVRYTPSFIFQRAVEFLYGT